MKLKLSGSVVELGIEFDIIGHRHKGVLLDCTGQRLIFVEMSVDEQMETPLYAGVCVSIVTLRVEDNLLSDTHKCIASRSPKERTEIADMVKALRRALKAGGNSAHLAFALVGAELAAAHPKE